MATNVIDKDIGLKRIIAELQKAKTVEVAVGILESAGANAEGVTIAEYAACNEYGTERIPSRPFMRTSFDENINAISADLDRGYDDVKSGKATVYSALNKVGEKHQDRIKNKILSNIPPENAPATIEKKKSSRTLIDTGAMKDSVRYLVRPVK